MSYHSKIHIVDADASRRAKIAFTLAESNFSPQIYESIGELMEWAPSDGLVLLNGETTGSNLERAFEEVDANGGRLPIAMYDVKPTTVAVVRAMLAGAIDYLEWPIDTRKLASTVSSFESSVASRHKEAQKKKDAASLVDGLSKREREVLTLLVKGHGNKQIALELGISPRTVEIHRAKVLVKLNAETSLDAVRIGIYAGLDE